MSEQQLEKLNEKASSEKARSAKLEAQNQKAKARLSKKVIDSHDHDAQAKIDLARISGKDRSTGDAKARLQSQIRQTENERDSVKKALKRKEGFSLSESDFKKSILVDEELLRAGSYSLKIPHMDITSVEALENALASLDCAMIVVSHDSHFLEKISNAGLVAKREGDSGSLEKQ